MTHQCSPLFECHVTLLTLQEGWSFELSGSDASFGLFGLFMSRLLSYERHSL